MQHKKKLSRRFWHLWTATTASSLGDGVFSVALPLLALRYTRAPIAISGVVIAGQIPAVLSSLPVGTLADRLNRRRMILSIEGARFALLAAFGALVLLGRADLMLIYCAAFLLGGLNTAFDVVANACLPSMVDRSDLVRANAHLLNAELTAENLVGQALGGAALAVSRALPFVADAISRAVSAVILNRAVPDNHPDQPPEPAWRDLVEGMRWFGGNRLLRLLTAVIGSLAFCQGIVLGLLALYAKTNLRLSDSGYGLLLALASIGTVVGGLAATRTHSRFGPGRTILLAGSLFGAAYPVLAVTHSPLIAAAALFLQEAAVLVGSTAARSLRQGAVPDHMQGRAASANFVVTMSCYPAGGLIGGVVAAAVGVSAAFMTAAIVQVALLAITGPRLLACIREAHAHTPESTREVSTTRELTVDLRQEPDPSPAPSSVDARIGY